MTKLIPPQSAAPSSLPRNTVRSGCRVTPTPQQPTTGVTMDTTYMGHTLGNVNMMVLGMELLLNAEWQREVSDNSYR